MIESQYYCDLCEQEIKGIKKGWRLRFGYGDNNAIILEPLYCKEASEKIICEKCHKLLGINCVQRAIPDIYVGDEN